MNHVSYEELRKGRRIRKVAVIGASVGTVALLATAIGFNSASAHNTHHTSSTSDTTMMDDMVTTTVSSVDPESSMMPGTTSRPTTSKPSNDASSMTSSSRKNVVRYSFRTIDDAKDPTFNQLLGINDHGRIVGYFGSGADAEHPNKGFRILSPYRQMNFFDKNFPGSAQTQVVGVNNAAVTVGFYVDGAGANMGFVAHGQQYTSVANPATSATAPFNQLLGINNHGVAVGFYNDADGASHGYTYDTRSGAFVPVLLPVPADSVVAAGIADDGDVSGFYTVDKVTTGFVFRRGKFQRLSFGAGTNTQALGVNNSDQVVGSYLDAAGAMHGFLWSPGGRLARIDDPNGSGGTLVNGLNNRGQLVGFYVDRAGNTHGFLASQHMSGSDSNS